MSFDLNSIFSQGKAKQMVGVSLTPGIGLEAVILDKANNQIVNYGKRDVAYNFATREIADKLQFVNELSGLLKDEFKLPEKTPVYFVLPNVLFDFMTYPSDINADGLSMMILSKAEEFYLFKKEEPVSGWCEVPNKDDVSQKKIVYTSFQKNVVDDIKDVVENQLKFTLAGIESAYSATLRGLYATGRLEEVLLEESPWTLMLINSNSYTLFNMETDNLVSYNEVPLALKSFSMEEAYQAIVSSSSQLLLNFPASKLFIVSQTDDISADVLQRELRFSKEIVSINSNRYAKEPVYQGLTADENDNSKTMTLSVLGAACKKNRDFHFAINVLQDIAELDAGLYKIPVNGKVYEITDKQVQKYALIILIIALLLTLPASAVLYLLSSNAKKELDSISSKIEEANNQKQQLEEAAKGKEQNTEVDITSIIDSIASMNVDTIKYYDSIAADIPKNVWLTKYYNRGGNKLVIKGVSDSINGVYQYYQNLKVLSPQSDIKLVELKVVTGAQTQPSGENGDNAAPTEDILKGLNINSDSDRLYSFEISNTSLGAIASKQNNSGDGNGNNSPRVDENNLLRTAPKKVIEETSSQMTETKQE